MPAWFLPAVKLILPHVGTIVAAAKPHFTKRKEVTGGDPGAVQEQIAELQAAVSDNAANIQKLAEQLELTIKAVEQAAATAQERVKRLYAISVVAMLVAIGALLTAIAALTGT